MAHMMEPPPVPEIRQDACVIGGKGARLQIATRLDGKS
jgi:hypothetical protein